MSRPNEQAWKSGLDEAIVQSGGNVRLMPLVEDAGFDEATNGGVLDCLPLAVGGDGELLDLQILNEVDHPSVRAVLAVDRECAVIVVTPLTRMLAPHRVVASVEHQLNTQRRVEGLRLRRCGPITSGQRRTAFRVRTLGLAFKEVQLSAVNGGVVTGMLANLSSTGAGLKTDLYALADADLQGDAMVLTLRREAEDPPLRLPCRLVRVGEPLGRTLDLGLIFDLERTANPIEVAARLERLRNTLERAALRRRKSA